ncbi:hypothetical protein FC093_23150 [Ilyomonas limi]|uniref:Uncharacterized protein n=1 Tax=Ilyomonas limi TaxID=2575867 RepID=A0A4U3KTE0_9BACT|nr:hypothetical protein [Ilyomonas limi]TKK64166.1 hypothetical protein FC093_23150 [Ilyomonas limi]
MNNKEFPAGTEDENELQSNAPTSSQNIANTHVVSRFSCPEGTIEIVQRTYPLNIDFNEPMFEPKRKAVFECEPIALKIHPVQS